ncbi:threonine--tRNA ligase 1, cytoplasmic-like isoform X2 [Homarus americanus]|uniref:threonine--tRNA ligase 1, cytoplasmic-like isoform X2 n=1 Tax=Homarus americanus TaxID=6706 RepID=UPI001C463C3C|nr:threonine--tRNA ligase 1, cytoplasmic-like isoform X2 [Homarus americanus]
MGVLRLLVRTVGLIKRNLSTQTYAQRAAGRNKKEKGGASGKGAIELTPWPDYIQERLNMWDRLKKEADEALAAKLSEPIQITLPDGAVKDGKSWITTPYEVAQGISQGLAENTVVAKVNGIVWDLDRPLEQDCKLELLKFGDDEAKTVFWHSSAHILGEALERVYGGHLCYGPPIEEGYYYDMHTDGPGVSNLDFPAIEEVMKKITKEKQPFERLEMKKEDLLEMFKYNKFKVRLLNEKVKTDTTTVYRCGPLIDLCRGPHVRHTGKVKAFSVTKNSASYWEGNSEAESLQRVYGISFPDPKQLKEWKHFQEEAAKRDHRKIGIQQKLYFFHELSPGSCFFTSRGAYIYNNLIELIRGEYRKRGFQEVVTPNVYNTKLWETSGHWQHYAENMFAFEIEKEKFALKPMNCPGHCLMFGHTTRSWRELPIRMADFGVLHRNELSGALTGLTRVRRFQQDDAHIFCTPDMIRTEIKGCLEFLNAIYDTLEFEFLLKLSTRPEKFLGEVEFWNSAEEQLKSSLNDFGREWKLNPGDGAFYGPKIDITVTDALKRQHQCATIQLDFQLPIRFDLQYVSETGEKKRPVIIHRAILGSVERMIAILTESFGGKWPFWLSPRQCMIVPVAPPFDDYAKSVHQQLHDAGFEADYDTDPGDTMNKKIRNAQLEQYNFILVVGEKEKTNNTLNVRTRDNKVHGEHSVADVIQKLTTLRVNRVKNWEDSF